MRASETAPPLTRTLLLALVTSSCQLSPDAPRESAPAPPTAASAPPAEETIPDTDGDSISDVDDRCCCLPEDRDGFQDEDGCPDRDNDGDGVLDAAALIDGAWVNCDQARWISDLTLRDCRDSPENYNGKSDEDGCAEQFALDSFVPPHVELPLARSGGQLEIPASESKSLESVAALMRRFSNCRYFVDTHSDAGVSKERARRQTEAAAEDVITRLVALGVDRELMIPRGFGLQQPIARSRGSAAASTLPPRASERRIRGPRRAVARVCGFRSERRLPRRPE